MSYSDDEQLEALKRWWDENGRAIVAGVVIAIVGVVGWTQWQAYQERQAQAASVEYAMFLQELNQPDGEEAARARAALLVDDYQRTPYASLALLWLAQFETEQGDYAAAEEGLRWVAENGDSESMRHIARLRLGRLLLAQSEYDAALAALAGENSGAFHSQYAELRGDVALARGAVEQAVTEYREALAAAKPDSPRNEIIRLKLADLGVDTEEPVS